MTKYWVTWRAKRTGCEGHSLGEFPIEEAKHYADGFNRKHGMWLIQYWIRAVDWPTPREPKPVPTGDFMGVNRMFAFALPLLMVIILLVALILGG